MATKRTQGAKGMYIDLPPELMGALQEGAAARGWTFREEVEFAIRRHLAKPVAKVAEGLAPATRKRGRPRKDRGNGEGKAS